MNKSVKVIDFNHHSKEHTRTWVETYRHLRANCPIAWTESHGGYYVVTRFDDVVAVAQDRENFTKRKWQDENGKWRGGGTIPTISGLLIPDDIDEPEWKAYRHLLNPWFTPKFIARSRAMAEVVASILVDAVIKSGRVEMIDQLASPLPTIMTLEMLGMPLEHWREYAEPSHEAVYTVPGTPEYARAVERLQWGENQMGEALKARRGNPGNDLISHITNARTAEGEYLSDYELMAICRQIIGGGADTTTSLLANVFIYLSKHPEARQRLTNNDPKVARYACEEFVRYFTPVHSSARTVKQPLKVAGALLDVGDKVFIAYASANRDEKYFEDPDAVKLDRFPNPHVGFGAGIHRCLGSHMARQSFGVLVNELLRRMPDFRVLEDQAEQYGTTGVVNGWVRVPAVFTPGRGENRDPGLAKRLRLGS